MDINNENQQKDQKLFSLMDMINNSKYNNIDQKINIPDYSMYSQINNESEILDQEDESKQSLNPEHNDLLDINVDSNILVNQNKYVNEQSQSISNNNDLYSSENEFETPLTSKSNTLDESIYTTLLRDIHLIYYKLKYVINPFISNNDKKRHIMQWDLWGPLLFITFLACTLAIKAEDKSNIIVIIFTIFWLGSILVYLNAYVLDSKIKLFPVLCLLGYCLFPLNISAFILAISDFYEIIRFFIVLLTCVWALLSIEGYFRTVTLPEQKYLIFYPAILLFLFLSWFIFATK